MLTLLGVLDDGSWALCTRNNYGKISMTSMATILVYYSVGRSGDSNTIILMNGLCYIDQVQHNSNLN